MNKYRVFIMRFVFIIYLFSFIFYSCSSTKKSTPDSEEPQSKIESEKKSNKSSENIHELIRAGNSEAAKNLFITKTDINLKDSEGNTPLHIAAQKDNADLVHFLIYKGASTEEKNNEGKTPLHNAIEYNAIDSVKELTTQGAHIFTEYEAGKNALTLVQNSNEKLLDALINPVSIRETNAYGQTLVHTFVVNQNERAMNIIINKKLPLSEKDINGKMPLDFAYKNTKSFASVRIAAQLILAGAEPVRGNFSYFEDAVKTRNPSMRFEDGQTPLHLASIAGQTGVVEYFLQRNASPNAKDVSGATPLHEAARYGHVDIVKILLAAGAHPNTKDVTGNTPLLLVIPHAMRDEIFDILLAGSADPNAKDIYGDTPLHIATMVGMDTSILTKLIAAGADSNERNKKGETPLAVAIDRQWTAQVSYYVSRGSDIHAEDINGNTPLSRALNAGINILSLVITPSTIVTRDSFGNTSLHVSTIRKTNPTLIEFLIKKGADVNARNRSGETPLYIAVNTNQRQIGELFLAHGADVFSTNVNDNSPLRLALTRGGETQDWILTSEVIKTSDGIGNTPLHYASEWQLAGSVSYIIEKGGDVNAKNSNGETPLFNAVKADSPSITQLLISKGAHKDSRDFLGNTALHSCVRWSATKAAAVLIKNGADINAQNISGKTILSEAARAGKPEMVVMLLDSKASIYVADATGKTVLIDAIQGNNIDIVRILLEKGASPSIQEMYGRNAYHEAAETGNITLITLIKNAGGNPLSRDSYGRTPFSLVLNKPSNIIRTILGTDINLIDSDGNTPIHIAVTDRSSPETFQMLLSIGYPVNRRNSVGVTPLLLAIRANLLEHTKLLLATGADPYITDNEGICGLILAFQNQEILSAIVQNSVGKTDIVGEGILHYAARYADEETMKRLLSMGLDRSSKSISGETPYNIAIRWQRPEIAELLK